LLVHWNVKQLCQAEGYLAGRAALSTLYLLQRFGGARRPLGKVISGDACLSPLLL